MGAGPKGQTRNYEKSMGWRAKRCQPTRFTDNIQENFSSGEKCIPQQGPVFQHETATMKHWMNTGKDWRTLKENAISTISQRKKLLHTKTIEDKRARSKFIKRPLKIQLVLETIELDIYNRKYGVKKPKTKKARKDSTRSSTSSELVGHTNQTRKRKPQFNEKKNLQTEIAASVENRTGH